MRVRLRRLWEDIRSSYWFVPTLMSLAAFGLVFAAGWVDERVETDALPMTDWVKSASPAAVRGALATIAASAISVAGVVFSITMVALTMASQQFGPRLIRNFMRQGWTQWSLGAFFGSFIYCLIALLRLPSETELHVPTPITVLMGVAIGVAAFAVLIYFIHQVAVFLQAPRVIQDVADDMIASIDACCPEPEARIEVTLPKDFEERARAISSGSSGYVQGIAEWGMIELARAHGVVVRLCIRPGSFVFPGLPLAWVGPAPNEFTEQFIHEFREQIVIGAERTATQDPGYAIDQLVEIAVRALSPGVNDPYTAINCVDQLSRGFAHLAYRDLPPVVRYDESATVRLVHRPYSYSVLFDESFGQIRRNANGNYMVTMALLNAMKRIAAGNGSPELREVVDAETRRLVESARDEYEGSDEWRSLQDAVQEIGRPPGAGDSARRH
ncbi:MAG: DUF2254 domain-containing protein [Phycisphaerales bacterium]